jgi:DNA-binding MarR family transcriptional regulator
VPKRPQTRSISEDALRTWRAFLRAHAGMLRRIGRDLEDAELPPLTWYDVLAALRDAPDQRLRQVEIADRVLLSHSGLSRLLDRIEAEGLVRRTQCAGDRRSFHVELTAAGAEMLERMWPVYARGIIEDFLPALGSDPREVGETLEAISRSCDDECKASQEETAADARAARAG